MNAGLENRQGVGIMTAAGFLRETGDISRFTSPKQTQKLAGRSSRKPAPASTKDAPASVNEGENG